MRDYTDLTKLENSRNCLRRIARHDEPHFSKDSIVNVMEKFVKTVNVMDETILVPCRLMDRQVGDSTDIIPAPGKNSTSNQHTLTASMHGKRGSVKSKHVHEFLNSSELFNLYNMLNALKNDLLWTGKDDNDDDDDDDENGDNNNKQQQNEQQTVELETTTATGNGNGNVGGSGGGVAAARNYVAQNSRAESIDSTKTDNANNITTTTTATTTTKGHVRRPSTASVASTASVSNVSDTESEISSENDSGVESESNKSDNTQLKKPNNADKATELAKRCKKHLNGLYQCLEQMTEAANYLTARYQSDIGPV